MTSSNPVASFRRLFPLTLSLSKGERGYYASRLFALLVLAAIFLLLSFPSPAHAQTAPTVIDRGVRNEFPQRMTFSVSAASDSPIEKIRLRYEILPDGTAASGLPDFDPAASVSTSFELQGNNPPNIYLPPGTVVEYHWEVTDADGDEARTETVSFFYDDVRFDWTPLEQDGVTVYSYSASPQQAQAMLNVAGETLTSISQLLGATIDFPVKIWLYESVDDMRPALSRRSETYEQSIVTAGTRVASDTVLVLGNASLDTLRHELTHVGTAVAGESAFGTLPAWLDEGTAVYGQKDQGGFKGAIDRAADRGNVLSVRSITSYPGDPNKVDLFYGQSWSLVNYLRDTYGPEKFAQLFAEIKGGKRIDVALEATYGFDQDGLEDEWRAALNLPPRPTPEPTRAPQESPADSTNSRQPRQSDDSGTSAIVIIALILGTLVLAAVVGFAGWTLSRRLR